MLLNSFELSGILLIKCLGFGNRPCSVLVDNKEFKW